MLKRPAVHVAQRQDERRCRAVILDTDTMHKAAMQMLEARSGDGFDKAYIEQMTKDHEKAVALFESAASSQKVDKELQSLASTILPTLHDHHMQIEKLSSGRSAAASDASPSSR
jgi:predicted outer membrane protein